MVTDKEFKDLSDQVRNLESEYKSDKKSIVRAAYVVGLVVVAFFGWTVASLPGRVKAELDATIGRETMKVIEGYKAQVEDQANQVERFKSAAKNNASEIANIKVNLGKDNAVLDFTSCGEEEYRCTPKACLAKCIELGKRMATYDEVYSWASAGQDHCAVLWMLDSKQSEGPVAGYPMYKNQTVVGICGRTNTGDIPRMEQVDSTASWDSEDKHDCACSSIITK